MNTLLKETTCETSKETDPARASAPPSPRTPNSEGREQVPQQWAWHYRTLLQVRNRLLQSHAEHASDATSPPDMRGVDIVDTTQERLDRDLLWAQLGAEENKLFEVDGALQRISDGGYGICEETGNRICPERLRAIPWARYSQAAAERRELQNGGQG